MNIDCPNNWVETELGNLLDYIQPGPYIVESTNYDDSYATPVLTAGKSFIKGFTNETSGIFKSTPVIIFDDFTTATQLVDFPFKVKSSAMKILAPASCHINIRYFYYLMQTLHVKTDSHKRYWIGIYSKVNVLLPPSNEQGRIVEKIEELFSELDKGVESLKAAKAQLSVYREVLLKQAFEGKLTERWRENNADKLDSPEQLLAQIQEERDARYKELLDYWETEVVLWEQGGKQTKKPLKPKALDDYRPSFSEGEESNLSLPSNWTYTSLSNFLEYVTSGSRGWAKYYSDSGATFIRAQNLKYDYLDLSDIAYVALPEEVEGKRTLTGLGDILITITGANVTKSALVTCDLEEAYVSQHVALCRMINPSLSKFVFKFIVSGVCGRRQLEKSAYGAGKPGLNLENIKELKVPITSTSECNAVTEILDESESIISKLENDIDLNIQRSSLLRQSILKQAFSGTLVSQDPNDEPADQLLKKIAIEKAELEKKVKAKEETEKEAARKARIQAKKVKS